MSEPADALRQTGLTYLTGKLASRRLSLGLLEPGPSDDEAGAELEVLVAIGALSAAEALEWRSRLARAESRPAEADPDARARANGYLDTIPTEDGRRLDAALAAFAGVGLIAPDEADARRGPMREFDEGETSLGPELERVRRVMEFDDSVLLRAVVGPARAVAGLRVTVVELYAGGIVVNWHYSAAEGESPEADALWSRLGLGDRWDDDDDGPLDRGEFLVLADQAGTDYLPAAGAYGRSAGGGRAMSGHASFAPAVPTGATYLDVLVQGTPLRVEL
jgi:hypothetical protein